MGVWKLNPEWQILLVLALALVVALAVWRWTRGGKAAALKSSAGGATAPHQSPKTGTAILGMMDHTGLVDRSAIEPSPAAGTASSCDRAASTAHDAVEPAVDFYDMPAAAQVFSQASAVIADDAPARCSDLLAQAQTQSKQGASPAAAALLRESILLAAAHGLSDQQALARLELGELARQDGDLITACEHWQIARGLFQDLKNKPRVKTIETRMREHGCPTDWVLNDF